jgi:hypothetical protein
MHRTSFAVAAAAAASVVWLWWRRCGAQKSGAGDDADTTWMVELVPGVQVEVSRPERKRLARPKHVVVVGAGIVGATIAAELSRRGCRCTVLEQESCASSRCTRYSWAWVNANSKQPAAYQALNMLGGQVWNAMLPGFVSWCGSLLLNGADDQAQPDYANTVLLTVDEVQCRSCACVCVFKQKIQS